jgi:acetyl-CoA carboxylase carboxyl transferase subunit alpha
MPADTLDFEEPIAVLLKEIEALSMLPRTPQRQGEIDGLHRRIESIRADIYAHLTAWQRVLVARHPNRPTVLDYVNRLFTEFTEPVMIVGHHKGAGADTKQKIFRNFGYARPEGYRKALRAMKLAEKFGRPVIAFIDTPAAYPGVESEERGIAEAIAFNLREMAALEVPIVVVVHGEGGSGGALGIAIGDRILMHEFAIYSVIPPEGCAAILWRDAGRKVEAAEALRLTAPDLLNFGIVDEIVTEPVGGAHTNHELATSLLDAALERALAGVTAMGTAARLEARYRKFRQMGNIGIQE